MMGEAAGCILESDLLNSGTARFWRAQCYRRAEACQGIFCCERGVGMWRFKACPRCGGDLYLSDDHYFRALEHCLQCGYLGYPESTATVEDRYRDGEMEPVGSASGWRSGG
jgi:hypothetical protein